MGRPLAISRSAQTCALGAAISGAVAAGAYASFAEARGDDRRAGDRLHPQSRIISASTIAFTGSIASCTTPSACRERTGSLYEVMKELLAIRDEVRRGVVHA